MSEWTFAQKALVILAALQLLWATAGLIAEPSFQIGADAPTTKVLWVDFNGIHALSGFLLFLPAFYFARRPDWALFDQQPGWSSLSPTTPTTGSSTSSPAPSSPWSP